MIEQARCVENVKSRTRRKELCSRKCDGSIGGSDADCSQDGEESELHIDERMLG